MGCSSRKTVGLLVVVFFFVFAGSAFGDLYWETLQETKAGQTTTSEIIKNYYSRTGSRVETGKFIMIMDYASMIMYQVDPQKKTYSAISLNQMNPMMQGPAGKGPKNAEKRKMFQQIMKGMTDSIQVTPTTEQKQIGGYDCHKVNVQVMMMSSQYWVSKEVPGYGELKEITAGVAEKFQGNPLWAQMTQASMLNKMDGFPVQVITNVSNRTMTTTLQKIQEKNLSPDLFKVPAGYTKVEPARMRQ